MYRLKAPKASALALVLAAAFAWGASSHEAIASDYSLHAPTEPELQHRGQFNVELGDHYMVGKERIELQRRADELVIQFRPQFDADQVIAGLTAPTGVLADFEQSRDFGGGLRAFRNPRVATQNLGPARSYRLLDATLASLRTQTDVMFAVPVFVNRKLGTYAVATDEVLVRLKPGVNPEQFFAATDFAGFAPAPASDAFLARSAAGAGQGALELAAKLQSDPNIVWAEPNLYQERQKFFTPDDTLFTAQWHLNNTGQGGGTPGADAKLVTAWDTATTRGMGVVVSIVDDGPEVTHPDLNLFVNTGETAGNGVDDDGNGFIDDVNGWDFTSDDNTGGPSTNDDEHGTSVAGVATARGNNALGVTGAAFNARFFPARIFLGSTATNDANIGAALAYSAGRGRLPASNTWRGADITNNSWGGGPPSTAISDALTYASTNGRNGLGTINFFATGNSGAASISLPASLASTIPSVFAVGASNNFDVRSSYSQFGPEIDFLAPSNGGSLAITTTDRLGALGYGGLPDLNYTNAFGGTSSATPLASGIGAVLLSLEPNMSLARVRNLMRNTADKIGPLAYTNGFNVQYGYGRLNAANLVRAVNNARVDVTLNQSSVVDGAPLLLNSEAGAELNLVFNVRSVGELDLTLANLQMTGDSAFTIGSFGSTTLPLSQATTFTVDFATATAGTYNATVTFTSNDVDHTTFDIPIQIVVVPVSIGGHVFEDWNNDADRHAGDTGIPGVRVYLDNDADSTFDAPAPTALNSAASLGLTISNAAPTSHTLTAAGLTAPLQGLEVRVRLTHSWVGDVSLFLDGPNGESITLARQPDGPSNSGDNMTDTVFADDAAGGIDTGAPPYTGRFRPVNPMSTFNDIDPNGNWTLRVTDADPADNGVLVNWSLTFFTNGEPSKLTDPDGRYSFLSLPPGTYRPTALTPLGWDATGSETATVTVVGTESQTDIDFGYGRIQSVYGLVYGDVVRDGNFVEMDDVRLPSVTTFVDVNGNGQLDPPQPVSQTRNPGTAIPDNNVTGITDNIAIAASGLVADATVGVTITHPFVGDLVLELISPIGTVINLINRRGGSGDNFTSTVLSDAAATAIASGTAPFTGTFRPEQPLSAVDGQLSAGNWGLRVSDRAGADLGNLTSWTLNLLVQEDRLTQSNAFGNYRFDSMIGASDLLVQLPPGFIQVEPITPGYDLNLAVGDIVFNRDFGIIDNAAPVAVADVGTVAEGGTLTVDAANGVLDNDTDADGDTLTAVLDTTTSNGTLALASDGSYTYTHNGGETTSDSFTYHARDGVANSNVVTVSITVTPVNDNAPVAVADVGTVAEGGTLTVTAAAGVLSNDTDADGSTLTAVLDTTTTNGTLTLNTDGSYTYVHNGGETTSDSFTYHANDTVANSNVVTVAITVTPVNDAPVAVADAGSVAEGGTLTVNAANGVLSNDTDAEGNTLTAVLDATTTNGTLALAADGSYTYVHDGGETTSDSFTYRADDGDDDSNLVTVAITVTPVNDAPTVVPPGIADRSNAEGAVINASIAGNFADADLGQTLTFTADVLPPGLSMDAAGQITGTISFAANKGSPYTVTVTANDGNGGTVTDTFSWTVTNSNQAPVVNDQAFAVTVGSANGAVVGTIVSSDPDTGDTRTVSVTGGTGQALFAVNATTGEITVANSAGLVAGASLTLNVTVTDAGGLPDTAVITIAVRSIGIFSNGFEGN